MSDEIWRPIPESNGMYEASNQGRIRSLKSGQPLVMRSQTSNALGHQKLDLQLDTRRCPRWVHRLVLAAFVGPCPEGQEVRHLDGDPTNNALENLTYGTRAENVADIIRHGRHNHVRKTHCPTGHEYTDANTYVSSDGRRNCRACRRIKDKKRRAA